MKIESTMDIRIEAEIKYPLNFNDFIHALEEAEARTTLILNDLQSVSNNQNINKHENKVSIDIRSEFSRTEPKSIFLGMRRNGLFTLYLYDSSKVYPENSGQLKIKDRARMISAVSDFLINGKMPKK